MIIYSTKIKLNFVYDEYQAQKWSFQQNCGNRLWVIIQMYMQYYHSQPVYFGGIWNSLKRTLLNALKLMINIQQAFGGLHRVVFVRFNPDTYIDHLEQKGKIMMNTRDKKLVEIIRMLIVNPPDHILSVCYLYYDGYDGTFRFRKPN